MADLFNQKTEIRQISAAFFAYRNDIEIYTEDNSDDKEFYRVLFNRLLDGTGIKINDIHPLGCCDDVDKAYENDPKRENKLYITDGDIYIMYSPKSSTLNKYVLDSYCIENFVCDETSFTDFLYNKWGCKTKEECKSVLDFNDRINLVKDEFISLYHYFALEKSLLGIYKLPKVDRIIDINKMVLKTQEITKIKTLIVEEIKNAGHSVDNITHLVPL